MLRLLLEALASAIGTVAHRYHHYWRTDGGPWDLVGSFARDQHGPTVDQISRAQSIDQQHRPIIGQLEITYQR